MVDLWTIAEVAAHLGIKPGSARGTLSRWGVRATDHRIDTHGRAHSLYDADEVRDAHVNRPGQGARKHRQARADLPPEGELAVASTPTAVEVEARVRAAGWEPAEPYPGSVKTLWSLRCPFCGHTVRRPSTPSAIKPCRHPSPAIRAKIVEDKFNSWRERVESGAGLDAEIARLKLKGWAPDGDFPGSVSEPWQMRCVRCGHEQSIVLADDLPACSHPGQESRPALTQQDRGERRDAFKLLRDERYEPEARAAGWEPVEPRPPREATPWKLRCLTCGEVVLARVSKGEHTQTCPHGLTADERAARDKFVAAGWEPLEHPVRGSLKTQWRIRCTACGHETRRAAAKKIQPCVHPDRR